MAVHRLAFAALVLLSLNVLADAVKCNAFHLKGVLKYTNLQSRACAGNIRNCYLESSRVHAGDRHGYYFAKEHAGKAIKKEETIPFIYMQYEGGCGGCDKLPGRDDYKCKECTGDNCNVPTVKKSFNPAPYLPQRTDDSFIEA